MGSNAERVGGTRDGDGKRSATPHSPAVAGKAACDISHKTQRGRAHTGGAVRIAVFWCEAGTESVGMYRHYRSRCRLRLCATAWLLRSAHEIHFWFSPHCG